MKRSGRSKSRPLQADGKQALSQYYLKEILRNIENIQTTILRKLNTEHQQPRQDKSLTHTPTSRQPKTHSLNTPKRDHAYHSLQATPKRPRNPFPKQPKPEHFATPISPEQLKHEALKKISHNQLSLLNKTTHFATNRPEVTLLKTREEKERTYEPFNTVRLKQTTPSNKENHFFSLSKTERTIAANQPTQRDKSIQTAQPTQAARALLPFPQNDIQKFYRSQIQRLQLEEQIRQLQEQLQRCLASKKAANLCEFQFLRGKMKRISVEIGELKEKRSRLTA